MALRCRPRPGLGRDRPPLDVTAPPTRSTPGRRPPPHSWWRRAFSMAMTMRSPVRVPCREARRARLVPAQGTVSQVHGHLRPVAVLRGDDGQVFLCNDPDPQQPRRSRPSTGRVPRCGRRALRCRTASPWRCGRRSRSAGSSRSRRPAGARPGSAGSRVRREPRPRSSRGAGRRCRVKLRRPPREIRSRVRLSSLALKNLLQPVQGLGQAFLHSHLQDLRERFLARVLSLAPHLHTTSS
jgi:hypothetical protein